MKAWATLWVFFVPAGGEERMTFRVNLNFARNFLTPGIGQPQPLKTRGNFPTEKRNDGLVLSMPYDVTMHRS